MFQIELFDRVLRFQSLSVKIMGPLSVKALTLTPNFNPNFYR